MDEVNFVNFFPFLGLRVGVLGEGRVGNDFCSSAKKPMLTSSPKISFFLRIPATARLEEPNLHEHVSYGSQSVSF